MAKFKNTKSRQLYQKAVVHFRRHFADDTIAGDDRFGWHFWTDVADFINANPDPRIAVERIVCSAIAALQIDALKVDDGKAEESHHDSVAGSLLHAMFRAGSLVESVK